MKDKKETKLYWPIEKLYPWDKNPRKVKEEDMSRLKKQIEELGEYKPLIITTDGEILGGNMRLRAYKELGFKQCWVSVVDAKTEAEKLKYALSDNDRVGFYIEDDLVNLTTQFQEEIDLSEFAVDLGSITTLEELLSKAEGEMLDDEAPPPRKETGISIGDIFQLGDHRLICGDATNIEHLKSLMGGQTAQMVFTDPPFNVNLEYNEYADNKSEKEYLNFCRNFMTNINTACEEGSAVYIMSGNQYLLDLANIYRSIFRFSQILFWVKENPTLAHSDYQFNYEAILYGWKTGNTHQFYGEDVVPAAYLVPRESGKEKTIHPAQRPLKLVASYIRNSSKINEIVLDTFGGSGTTLIAAEKLNRICYMIELDPVYCGVILDRWSNLTKFEPIRISDNKSWGEIKKEFAN